MTDIVDRKARSRMMSKIRGRDTGPELMVRSFVHRAGLRFRIHASDLPGRPDLVLPRWNTVIFVHGCFWHRHKGCPNATLPSTNKAFWRVKLNGNRQRDRRNEQALRTEGWRVLTIWECGLDSRALARLVKRVKSRRQY